MKSTSKIMFLLLSCLLILTSCLDEKKMPKVPKDKLILRETAKLYYENYDEKYEVINKLYHFN